MTDSDNRSTGLSIEKTKSEAKFFGIASAVILGIVFFLPVKIIQAFAFLGLFVAGWQFLFYGTTSILMLFQGVAQRRFKIAFAVVVPLLLSLYSIKDATSISLQGIMGHMFSLWFLVALGIMAYVSWAAADQLNPDHPFRGVLITYLLFTPWDTTASIASMTTIPKVVPYTSTTTRENEQRRLDGILDNSWFTLWFLTPLCLQSC